MIARWAAAALAGLLAVMPTTIRAATVGPAACPVPPALAAEAPALPQAKAAIVGRRGIVVLAVGGVPMSGAAVGGSTYSYPARMQAHLAVLLPDTAIEVHNLAAPRRDGGSTGEALVRALGDRRPDLVLWASGTREAVRHVDPAAYARTLEEGIAAIRGRGADPILLDVQFAPGWAAVPDLETYRDVIRTVGELTGAAVFPRHELMRQWHEDGRLDLAAADRAEQLRVARLVHDCVGAALAAMVAAGVR